MPLRFIGPLMSLKSLMSLRSLRSLESLRPLKSLGSLRSLRPFKVLRVVANKVEMLINCAILSNSGGAKHFAPYAFGVRRNGDMQYLRPSDVLKVRGPQKCLFELWRYAGR